MKTRRTPMVWIFMAIVLVAAARPQPASAQLTITDPASDPEIAATPFRSAAHRMPSRLDAGMTSPQSLTQMRVRIQYLMVDAETRKRIYAGLPADSVTHVASMPDDGQFPPFDSVVDGDGATVGVQTRLVRPSHATHGLLSVAQVESMIQQVDASPTSSLRVTPSILLFEGKSAEMNDLTQRPFVVDLQSGSNGQTSKPTIQLLDEGSQIRVRLRYLAESASFQLSATMVCSHVTDVTTEMIYGVNHKTNFSGGKESNGPAEATIDGIEIQVPTYSSKRVGVEKTLAAGELLMIDPYYATPQQVQQTTPAPMLGRLPYIGQNFTNRAEVQVEQYLIALLQPELMSR